MSSYRRVLERRSLGWLRPHSVVAKYQAVNFTRTGKSRRRVQDLEYRQLKRFRSSIGASGSRVFGRTLPRSCEEDQRDCPNTGSVDQRVHQLRNPANAVRMIRPFPLERLVHNDQLEHRHEAEEKADQKERIDKCEIGHLRQTARYREQKRNFGEDSG